MELEIVLEKYTTLRTFEKTLSRYYKRSCAKKNKNIIFNLSGVEHISIFELSRLSLWILKLNEIGKLVFLKSPRRDTTISFLKNYEFYNFLRENKIEADIDKVKVPYAPAVSPMFPLSFQSKSEFRSLLNELSIPSRVQILFKEINQTDLVKKNVIHSIILKEVSDNVFVHTRCKSANIIMTKLGGSKYYQRYLMYKDEMYEFEKIFFDRLGANSYLSLVISDNGPGIFGTLLDAYMKDTILSVPNKKDNPEECDILEYSFYKHSTSRTEEERKRELSEKLKEKLIKYPLPTGLYKVLNYVKQFEGMMLVRSGYSFISYNYFNQDPPIIIKNTDYKETSSLECFNGTQFRFYFPLIDKENKSYTFGDYEKIDIKKERVNYFYLSLSDYFPTKLSKNDVDEIGCLQKCIDTIEAKIRENEKTYSLLIFNCCNFNIVNSKNIVNYIVAFLMAAQNQKTACVLVNLSWKMAEELIENFEGTSSDLKSLIAIDNIFKFYVVGGEKYENDIIRKILLKGHYEDKIDGEKYNNLNHLLKIIDNNIVLKFSKNSIVENFKENIKQKLSEFIGDYKNKIFYPNIKVLLPNKYFCEGFYEIYNIFDYYRELENIKTYLSIFFYENKPDFIVTLGENCKKIVEEIFNDFKAENIKIKAKNYNIPNDQIDLYSYKVKRMIGQNQKVILLADVIGRGDTISDVIKRLNKNEIRIAALINAKEDNSDIIKSGDKNYVIQSIVKKALSFSDTRPKSWNYSDIRKIDLKTGRIINPKFESKGPLWIRIEKKKIKIDGEDIDISINRFLEEVVGKSNSFFNGHFESRNNCLTCLFNIPILIENYSSNIQNVIKIYTEDHIEIIEQEKKGEKKSSKVKKLNVSYVIYPSFNPGLEKVAADIAKVFPGCGVLPLNEGDFNAGIKLTIDLKNNAVIIIDDAFVTGSTLDKLIDVVSEEKPTHIFVYVLLKRGNDFQARKFEKLKQVGDSTIEARYLVDAEIPIYKKSDCPICKHLEKIDAALKDLIEDSVLKDLREFILAYSSKWRGKKIGTIFSEDKYLKDTTTIYNLERIERNIENKRDPFTYVNMRWKIEQAKQDLGMKKDIHDIIKNYNSRSAEALLMLKIFSDEKSELLEKSDNNEFFYQKFETNLIKCCEYFLEHVEKLDAEAIKDVINVLMYFNENSFINLFDKILTKVSRDRNKLYIVVMMVLISQTATNNPLKIIDRIEVMIKQLENREIKKMFVSLIDMLREKNDKLKRYQKIKIERYREIRVSIHDINHKIEGIDQIIRLALTANNNIDLVKNAKELRIRWQHFNEHFNPFLINIVLFINSIPSDEMSSKLNEIYTIIEISYTKLKMAFGEEILEKKEIESIKNLIERIKYQVFEKENNDGLIKNIDELMVDPCHICYNIYLQEKNYLDKAGINFTHKFPINNCIIFGEESRISLIFKNLIQNVRKHSGAKHLHILGKKDENEEYLRILILDDGEMQKRIIYKEGLQSVTKWVASSGGSFSIERIDENYQKSNKIDSKFKTCAMVYLPLIYKEKENVNEKHSSN